MPKKLSSTLCAPLSSVLQFFPELNEPARPAAARPVSRDMGGRAAGGSAVRTERRDEIGGIRRIGVMIGPAGG